MILFIIIAVCILFLTTIDELLPLILETNRSAVTILKAVNKWFWMNVGLNLFNVVMVWMLSIFLFFGLCFVLPSETSQWEFGINALEDNLVTQGQFYGRRGYVDGELSYFYSRSFANGEKIGHMPANKTYIKYDNDARPHVEVHNTRKDVPEWLSKVFFIDWMNQWSTEYYVLIVPEGTITSTGQYEIDME
jgi:hypothetical protein